MKKAFIEATQSASSSLIIKSNALARARYPARSVIEHRLVALVASKVNPCDEDFKTYQIHISELFGKRYGPREIHELECSVKNIMSQVIEIREESFDGLIRWTQCNIFSLCSFTKSTGIIEVCFHKTLLPHYLHLKQYVQYRLDDFLSLPSVYSQRMYEFLKSWASCPTVTVALQELCDMMDIDDYMRRDFAQFRIKVLEKSKKDLELLTGFKFDWEPIKKGRKVEKIRFIFPNSRSDRWKKICEAGSQRAAQIRAQALACFALHGDACVGGHQDDNVCAICINTRNDIAKKNDAPKKKNVASGRRKPRGN